MSFASGTGSQRHASGVPEGRVKQVAGAGPPVAGDRPGLALTIPGSNRFRGAGAAGLGF